MPPRQLLAFQIGCWAAVLTAVLHLVGHLLGSAPPANAEQEALLRAMTTVTLVLPDGTERTTMELLDGFSLSYSLFLALWGGLGLMIQTRGREDAVLMHSVSRAMAGAAAVLLVISLTYWFLVPALASAFMAISFAVAAVKAP